VGVQVPAGSWVTHSPSKQKLPSSQSAEVSQRPPEEGQPVTAVSAASAAAAAMERCGIFKVSALSRVGEEREV
jgi:hypothetical protein